MKHFWSAPTLLLLLGIWGCTSDSTDPNTVDDFPIIPLPQSVAPGLGFFTLNAATGIQLEASEDSAAFAKNYLTGYLQQHHQITLSDSLASRNIRLQLDPSLVGDYYELLITQKGVLIKSGRSAGLFYGVQSLLQLTDYYAEPETADRLIPCGYIKDEPRFPYRGMHLDVARHFFPVDFVKQYIDLLARYKMNRFHWHLTEDQGWRIEIKQYPKLQEVAAYRSETLIGHYSDQPHQFDGERYGGYYTQDEIREIVRYAGERFVTIIPEIEMPGHSTAAIAAYPELSCHGRPVEPATKWGVFEDIYCPTETTFAFLENVLTEVMALFPSEYIHIGGDEAPKIQWEESTFCQKLMAEEGLADESELQAYFIRRIEKFLNQNGRQLIGWDEILEGGLAPNATVMSWRGEQGGIEAAKAGHDVVMTPTTHCYFDYYQSDHPDEPLAIGGYLPLEKVYNYHPVPDELSDQEAQHILGTQGNLWTEYIPTPEQAEYMAYPRMMALAEVAWTGDPERKDFEDFIRRLRPQIMTLRDRGLQVATTIYNAQPEVDADGAGPMQLRWSNVAGSGTIRLSMDGTAPDRNSTAYQEPIPVTTGTYCGQTFLPTGPIGHTTCVTIDRHKGANKPITLQTEPHPSYLGNGAQSLLNGIEGNDDNYANGEWLGFRDTRFTAVIDLEAIDTIREMTLRFFHRPGSWIYAPDSIEVAFAKKPDAFGPPIRRHIMVPAEENAFPVDLDWTSRQARYVRIRVTPLKQIPKGRPGAGTPPFYFIDEIVLR